jgi:hypothetical protein
VTSPENILDWLRNNWYSEYWSLSQRPWMH